MRKRHRLRFVLAVVCCIAAMLLMSCQGSCAAPCEHSFGEWEQTTTPTCIQNGRRQRICSLCGFAEIDSIPPLGHMFLWVTDREPTQTQPGQRHEECVRCAFVRKEEPIDPLGHQHSLVELAAKAPTCTDSGNAHYVFCTVCYAYFTDLTCSVETTRESVTLPALGHSFTSYTPNGDATSDSDGTKTAWCDRDDCTATQTITDSGSILVPQYTVTFYAGDGVTVLSEQSVRRGDDATPPTLSGADAQNFLAWQGSYVNVTEDRRIYALLETRENVFVLSCTQTDGDMVSLTLAVRGVVELCGVDMRLLFDSSLLTLSDITARDASVMAFVPTDGVVHLNLVSGENKTEPFELLVVTFRAVAPLATATTVHLVCDNCICWSVQEPNKLAVAEFCTADAVIYLPLD